MQPAGALCKTNEVASYCWTFVLAALLLPQVSNKVVEILMMRQGERCGVWQQMQTQLP
jgi:hypothetical protein